MVKIAKDETSPSGDLPHMYHLTLFDGTARCIRLFIKQAYLFPPPKQVVFRSKIFPIVGFLHTRGFNPDINIRLQLGPSWPSRPVFLHQLFLDPQLFSEQKRLKAEKDVSASRRLFLDFAFTFLPINNKQETRIGGCYRLSVFPQIIIGLIICMYR